MKNKTLKHETPDYILMPSTIPGYWDGKYNRRERRKREREEKKKEKKGNYIPVVDSW